MGFLAGGTDLNHKPSGVSVISIEIKLSNLLVNLVLSCVTLVLLPIPITIHAPGTLDKTRRCRVHHEYNRSPRILLSCYHGVRVGWSHNDQFKVISKDDW
jgi:hypothetical protein